MLEYGYILPDDPFAINLSFLDNLDNDFTNLLNSLSLPDLISDGEITCETVSFESVAGN